LLFRQPFSRFKGFIKNPISDLLNDESVTLEELRVAMKAAPPNRRSYIRFVVIRSLFNGCKSG